MISKYNIDENTLRMLRKLINNISNKSHDEISFYLNLMESLEAFDEYKTTGKRFEIIKKYNIDELFDKKGE